MQKLLDAGALVMKEDILTLKRAVRVEHTDMMRLLLRLRAGIWSDRAVPSVLKMAEDEGLESMADS